MLGLLIFGPFILNKETRYPVWRGLKIALWGVALYLCTFMLMASQSRAAYLVSVIVIPLTLWLQDHCEKPPKEASQRLKIGLQIATLFLIVQGLAINHEAIWHRIAPDLSSLKEIVSSAAPLSTPPAVESSLTLRWTVLQEAFRVIQEKPFFGWGPLASRSFIASSGDQPLTMILIWGFSSNFNSDPIRGLITLISSTLCSLAIYMKPRRLNTALNGERTA